MSDTESYRYADEMGLARGFNAHSSSTIFPYAGQERYHSHGGEVSFDCYMMFLRDDDWEDDSQGSILGFDSDFPREWDMPQFIAIDHEFHRYGFLARYHISSFRKTVTKPMFFDSRKRVYRGQEVSQRLIHCERVISETPMVGSNDDDVVSMAAALLRPMIASILLSVATSPVQCIMIIGSYRNPDSSPAGVLQIQVGNSCCDMRVASNFIGEMYLVATYSIGFTDDPKEDTEGIIREGVSTPLDVAEALMPFVVRDANAEMNRE